MANCMFVFPDYIIPNSYVSPVLSGGSWRSPDYALTNLQDSSDARMSTVARSTDATLTSTIIKIKFGATRDVRVLVVCRHNGTVNVKVRLQLYTDDAWTTLAYDTGATFLPMYSEFYPPGALMWGSPGLWEGVISDEDRNGYKFDYYFVLPSSIVCQSARVSFDDTANADGYFELARCMLAPAWQPQWNISYGSGIQWNDVSSIERSLGGVRWANRRPKYRTLSGILDTMTDEQAVGVFFELQRRLGITGECYYIFNPDDVYQAMKQRSFMATFKDLGSMQFTHFDGATVNFLLEEIL